MKTVYIDMDHVLCDFYKAYYEFQINYFRENGIIPEEGFKNIKEMPIFVRYPQSNVGFFENLEPIQGGVETIKELIESDVYDPYILTAPSIKNPLSYSEKRLWIEHYFGLEFCNKLIISPNKGLLKGDFLIDDYNEGKGQENFEGELIHFLSESYPTWQEVRKRLGLNYLSF